MLGGLSRGGGNVFARQNAYAPQSLYEWGAGNVRHCSIWHGHNYELYNSEFDNVEYFGDRAEIYLNPTLSGEG